MVNVREDAEVNIGNRRAVVTVDRARCKKCGENFYTPDQMDAAQLAAAAKLRKHDNLLGPDEIREIRATLGLTQAQLEQLLGVGPKTVVRWERGTVFQSRTADDVLRMLTEVPGVFEYLALKHGVECSLRPQGQSLQTSRYVTVRISETPGDRRSADVVPFPTGRGHIQHKQMRLQRQEATTIRTNDIRAEAMR